MEGAAFFFFFRVTSFEPQLHSCSGPRWAMQNEAWPSLMKVLQDSPVDDPHEPGAQVRGKLFSRPLTICFEGLRGESQVLRPENHDGNYGTQLLYLVLLTMFFMKLDNR